MSAFFISINRSKELFDQETAQRMMQAIEPYGKDEKQLIVKDNFAIGYQSFWTVPEEVGEQQPLYDKQNDIWFVFAGRVDNRDELFKLLSQPSDNSLSDAKLILMFYKQFGRSRIKDIIGPFVFVYYCPQTMELFAARDAMGGRYLTYKCTQEHIFIATYELAICNHPAVGFELEESKLAHALAFSQTPRPLSYAKGIEILSAGNYLELKDDTLKEERFYVPKPSRIMFDSDLDYANEFKRLLSQSVERRLRSNLAIGSMLSGGLDSVPMSIAAAKLMKVKRKQLHAFSWSFNDHPECDETIISTPVCEQNNIKQHLVNCDELWVKFDETMPVNPIVPLSTPYYVKHQALLKAAKQNEIGVLLSGYAGDMLFTGTTGILYELLKSRRFSDFFSEFRVRQRHYDSNWQFIKDYFIKPVNASRYFKAEKNNHKREYLSTFANDKLLNEPHCLEPYAVGHCREKQFIEVFSHAIGDSVEQGQYQDGEHNIQKRYPFRDRDLVEFMLAIPSDQLYFKQQVRPIVKRAFSNELGDKLLKRNTKTSFYSFIASRMNQDTTYQRFLGPSTLLWDKYINDCEFNSKSSNINEKSLIKWALAYYRFWSQVCYDL